MARKKSVLPRCNMQIEMPPTLVAAIDMAAEAAQTTRSKLVRSILAEYVEIKFGPKYRDRVAAWEKYGSSILTEFMKQTLPAIQKTYDKSYLHEPQEEEPTALAGPVKIQEQTGAVLDSIVSREAEVGTVSHEAFVAEDPEYRSLRPAPTHFRVTAEKDFKPFR